MKTWLSGMSPVAADAASPCSADGPEEVEAGGAVEVVGFALVVVGVVVVGEGAAACFELPQPARRAAFGNGRAPGPGQA